MNTIKPTFSAVMIVTKPVSDKITDLTRLNVVDYCTENQIPWRENESLLEGRSEVLVVAIGGDGTMLGAMRESLKYDNPIVFGINTGTLGFLSEDLVPGDIFVRPTELKEKVFGALNDIRGKRGMIEERMLLTGTIKLGDRVVYDNYVAVNEFVLAPTSVQHALVVDVEINKNFVSSNLGSGVLVSTSTGSTAMALSGGGAIISPSTNIIQIVPILAHSLTARPIITTGRDTISLKTEMIKGGVDILADGIWLYSCGKHVDDPLTLIIKKHPQKVKVYRPADWNFFNVLRVKMKW